MLNKILSNFINVNDEEKYSYGYFMIKDHEKLFDNHYLEMAHVSVIWEINKHESKSYLHAPYFWKNRGLSEVVNGVNINAANWIRLKLKEDSLFPIGVEDGLSLISPLLSNLHVFDPNDKIIIKLMIKKRSGAWRDTEIEKYEHFITGNELAIESGFYRSIWNILNLKAKSKIRSPIKEIEQKIIDDQYSFECMIGIDSNNNSQIKLIKDLIKYSCKKLSGMNCFFIEEIKSGSSIFYEKQYLSRNEINSFLAYDNTIELTKDIIEEGRHKEKEGVNAANNIFDLLPMNNNKSINNEYRDISLQIPKTLKRIGVIKSEKDMKLDHEMDGLSFIRCQYFIPKDLVYSKIIAKKEDVQVSLGVSSLSIEQGDKPDTIGFLIAKQNKNAIYLSEVLSDKKTQNSLIELEIPFFVGLDSFGKPIFRCLTSLTHLLIAGETGGGKSNFLNQAILTMLLFVPPSRLNLYLIDPKQVELVQFKEFPHVNSVITDPKEASLKMENEVIQEMEKRYELFKKRGAKDIKSYNQKNPHDPLPYIVIIIDEFADLKMANPQIVDSIQKISQKARASGIHLIIATQQPNKNIVDTIIKDNIPSKISFRLSTSSGYRTVFGTGVPFELLGSGHGVMKLKGQIKPFEQFQSAVISLNANEEEKTYKKIISYVKSNRYLNPKVVEESPLDKIKRIIASTGEVRARKLREEMRTRPEVIKELMHQLIEDRWLIKHEGNRGYELIASKEELNKWRS
ncbi:FtsK/SpoIIIE domain-containing protein [Halalkalibacter oceani]|uniref:FtsK/SpoIIIE domain-containing protein n=1 Tax=Halalkalibacter oceani TaxID=1653776 RepID=UPI003398770D